MRFFHTFRIALLFVFLTFAPLQAPAQDISPVHEQTQVIPLKTDDGQSASKTGQVTCGVSHLGQCLKDLGHDQVGIWTSPLRIAPADAIWLVPFAAGTALAIHYDPRAQQDLGIDQTRIDVSKAVSQLGSPYATFGEAAGLYLIGSVRHDEHLAETGRLGAEAVLNASIVVEGIKLATNRERPDQGMGGGGFWPQGTRNIQLDGSFPSGHAAASWALARVIASEYPSRPVQFGAYAFALAISASRVTSRRHFPSDVLVGGTFGYLIGGYVLHHHASEYEDLSVSFFPMLDQSTRTYGLRVNIIPGKLWLKKDGGLPARLHASE
jgi:hypothetical protein